MQESTFAERIQSETNAINAEINRIGVISYIEKDFKTKLPTELTINNRIFTKDKDTNELTEMLDANGNNAIEQEEIYNILQSDPDGFELVTQKTKKDTNTLISRDTYYPIAPMQGFYFETYETDRRQELGLNDTNAEGSTPYTNYNNIGTGDYKKRQDRINKAKRYYGIEKIVLTTNGTVKKNNTRKIVKLTPAKAKARALATAKRNGKLADKEYITKLVKRFSK